MIDRLWRKAAVICIAREIRDQLLFELRPNQLKAPLRVLRRHLEPGGQEFQSFGRAVVPSHSKRCHAASWGIARSSLEECLNEEGDWAVLRYFILFE